MEAIIKIKMPESCSTCSLTYNAMACPILMLNISDCTKHRYKDCPLEIIREGEIK